MGEGGDNHLPAPMATQGVLRKRGQLHKTWKERWFVVEPTIQGQNELSYFTLDKKQRKGGIDLAYAQVTILYWRVQILYCTIQQLPSLSYQ